MEEWSVIWYERMIIRKTKGSEEEEITKHAPREYRPHKYINQKSNKIKSESKGLSVSENVDRP